MNNGTEFENHGGDMVRGNRDRQKVNEEGSEMLVKERYVVNALNFTECEAILNSELIPEAVVAEKFASFREVITSDDEKDEEWFKVKIDLTNIDEKTGKEKHTKMIISSMLHQSARRGLIRIAVLEIPCLTILFPTSTKPRLLTLSTSKFEYE